jgi:hypothetical protein
MHRSLLTSVSIAPGSFIRRITCLCTASESMAGKLMESECLNISYFAETDEDFKFLL